jgi:hypothetical protein
VSAERMVKFLQTRAIHTPLSETSDTRQFFRCGASVSQSGRCLCGPDGLPDEAPAVLPVTTSDRSAAQNRSDTTSAGISANHASSS